MKSLLLALIRSSIGKKCIMALTGLGALGFLLTHLYGNLYVYKGQGRFDAYAHHLHDLPFLPIVEASLVCLFAVHIGLSIVLTLQNRRARTVRYSMVKRAGGSTAASSTMIYSGLAILAFMLFHVIGVKMGAEGVSEFNKLATMLSHPITTLLYVLGVSVVGIHLYHGISSTFQSLGLMHPMYDNFVILVGRISAVVLAVAFASVPLFIMFYLSGGLVK